MDGCLDHDSPKNATHRDTSKARFTFEGIMQGQPDSERGCI